MAKSLIKEIIIVLLLTLAIILILGVILYEYVPSNKVIPEKVSYTTPAELQEELKKEELIDQTELVVTYQIDATDLRNYQRINEYVPGKKNPFEEEKEEPEETEENNNGSSNGTVSEKTSESKSSTKSSENGTGYLPDKGTK